MSTPHTPGPWILHLPENRRQDRPHDKRIMVLHPDCERLVCRFDEGSHGAKGPIPPDEIRANARLVSAAPDMLEALMDVQKWADPMDLPPDTRARVRGAIAKATSC